MGVGVYIYMCGCLGEVGRRDMFSAVIICMMDLFIFNIYFLSSMSVYYYQFNCFSHCSNVLFTC